jgi:hypothetical protein
MKLSIIPARLGYASYTCIRRILSLSREIIDPPSEQPRTPPVVFGGGQSIANDLRLCVTSCRDKSIIRGAIELMHKHPQGDGLWDTIMIVKMAEVSLLSRDLLPRSLGPSRLWWYQTSSML